MAIKCMASRLLLPPPHLVIFLALWRRFFVVLLALMITLIPLTSDATAYIAGSFSAAPANVNLTSEGVSDWGAWGNPDAPGFNYKHGVARQISNYTAIGGGIPSKYTGTKSAYSWSDGAPIASATNVYLGARIKEPGGGFELTVPADTVNRTLKVYVGARLAKGRFEASLSGGAAPAYVSYVDQTSDKTTVVFTLDYRAASAGQTLKIRYVLDTAYTATKSNITLEGAALLQGAAP
jgi:hypothetical protein